MSIKEIKNNGWISVDDMLPKEFEKVLLFGKYLNEETFQEVGHYIPEFAKQFEKQGCFSIRGIVTHWQPLPQPPVKQNAIKENKDE